MKKIALVAALVALTAGLSGCGGDTVGKTFYPSYGIATESTDKDPNIIYQVSVGSVIVAIIFCETIVVPVYIVGCDLFTPVAEKPASLK